MSNKIDQTPAYAEACNALRHYSNASLAVRSASIVQGLAILFPWAYALSQAHPNVLYAFGLPFAGLVFTGLLYCFNFGYFRAVKFFYDQAAQMERKLFEEDCRPIAAYNLRHDELYKSTWSKFFILNAPFTLIGLLCIAALIADVLIFACHCKVA
jgi:hypothetical protein